ncbi:MAG: hypothetical protein JW715_07640 [Sedimentisphaerales bacterium]|nr:hypothetical protein [Sedimentisphaerales bacterium]
MPDKEKDGISQFERLKQSGQLVKKEGKWLWCPRTLAEYKELANSNYNHYYRILHKYDKKMTPQFECEKQSGNLFEISGSILYAFTCAEALILWSRKTECEIVLRKDTSIDEGKSIDFEIRYPWILYCESLSTITQTDRFYAARSFSRRRITFLS